MPAEGNAHGSGVFMLMAGVRQQLIARRTQISNAIRGYAACCSSVFAGTNCIVGRLIASHSPSNVRRSCCA
jgi:hypothetical protein